MRGRRKTRLISTAIMAVGGLVASAVPLAAAAGASTPDLGRLPRYAPPPSSAAPLPLTCTESGGLRSCDLYAHADTVTIAGNPFPVWAFDTAAVPDGELPGPVLVMMEGEDLDITLTNDLPGLAGPLSLSIPAAAATPDAVGITAPGSSTYSFSDLAPGTYLYQAGPTVNAPRQIAMGLTGTLIVRPAAFDYGLEATWGFDAELPILVSEIDPAFNADPVGFDMGFFNPSLFLINGEAYPDTSDIPLTIDEHDVLMHYVNGGVRDRSLGVVNARGGSSPSTASPPPSP